MIGTLVATALSMAADAALKGAVGEAFKDAYKALKEQVAQWAAGDVEALAKTPTSASRQGVIAEIVDAQPQDDQDAVRALAETLVARLKDNAPAIGLDVRRLEALEVQLGTISVEKGTGARFEDIKLAGTFRTGDIVLGTPPGKL
jgi:hypothetical protein